MKKNKTQQDDTTTRGTEEERGMMAITRALSDPSRVAILRHIASRENASCMDLRECLSINPATLSHHMRQLESAGLIETHRDGKLVRAEIRRKVWKNYLASLKDLV